MTKPFKLSAVLYGHSADVRALFARPDDSILSGSRDKTAKSWHSNGFNTGYTDSMTYKDQKNFVGAVLYLGPTPEHLDGLIVTGGNDHLILLYQPHEPFASVTLKEHKDAVCTLSAGLEPGTFFSGSWDATAKLWSLTNKSASLITFAGHKAAIWSVIQISNGNVVTASADKCIIIWNINGQQIKSLNGHSDCVRGLADFADQKQFLSVSNDATIKVWNYGGENLNTLYGHTNYIYSIARNLAGGSNSFVTSDEDHTVRFWQDGRNTQSFKLPAQSVWCVSCLANGDIVTGASDGAIRIFTQDENRVASEDVLKQYEEIIAAMQKQNQQEIGGYKVSDLPGPEALYNPGKNPGEIKMIREGEHVVAYNWVENGDASHWEKVGDVLGANEKANEGKTMYEGKPYDFVFSVDVEDGKPPLKLPYNRGEDVYVAAHKFLSKHMLPAEYLEQVVEFITKNSNESTPMAVDDNYVDPFTGASRYTPSSTNLPNAIAGGGMNYDPLTGGSSYTTSAHISAAPVAPRPTNVNGGVNLDPLTGGSSYTTSGHPSTSDTNETTFFPQTSYIRFDMGDPQVILNKLKEFNQKIGDGAQKIEEEAIVKIGKLCTDSCEDETIFNKLFSLLHWPEDKVFPVIDVFRLAVRDRKNNNIISQRDDGVVLDKLKMCIGPTCTVPNNTIVAFRALCNLFQHASGEQLIYVNRLELLELISSVNTTNKNIQIGLATFLLNLSILVVQRQDEIGLLGVSGVLPDTLSILNDPEAQFRAFVGIGTLLSIADRLLSKELKCKVLENSAFCKNLNELVNVASNSDVEKKRSKCAAQVEKELLL